MVFTIEMAAQQNNDGVFYNPIQERLRGRWESSRVVGHSMGPAIATLMQAAPTIPGLYVTMDAKTAQVTITDPLKTTPEGREIWSKISEAMRKYPHSFGGPFEPHEDKAVDHVGLHGMDEFDVVKTHAWSMRQLIDGGMARLVGGSDPLPTAKEINEWPGRRIRDFGYGGNMVEMPDEQKFTAIRPRPDSPKAGKPGKSGKDGAGSGNGE